MEGVEEGVKVGGKILKNTEFADDRGMVAGTEHPLQKLMDGLNGKEDQWGQDDQWGKDVFQERGRNIEHCDR